MYTAYSHNLLSLDATSNRKKNIDNFGSYVESSKESFWNETNLNFSRSYFPKSNLQKARNKKKMYLG